MNPMYPKNGKVILHVDMNSFYASVETAYDPELKGKPLAIAGNAEERRGIIVTCSYEARKFGVRTTMPLWEAKKVCPHLIVKNPNFDRYRQASLGIFELLRQYTMLVEPVSIDEGYLDITDCADRGSPVEIAQSIQKRILDTMNLPCSIGIAPNKFLAKTASNMKKPLGISILRKRELSEKIWPLDVSEMHGIGKKTAEKLNSIDILTIGQLAHASDWSLKTLLGINGLRLKEWAKGLDRRPVDPNSVFDYKSIGNSTTLPQDSSNQKELVDILSKLSEKVAYRLKNKNLVGTKIGITIRYKDRRTITRSKKMDAPFSKKEEILKLASTLFNKHWNGDGVRLLGVTAFDVIERDEAYKQLDLFSFEDEAVNEPLYHAMEKLKSKYGKNIIKKGMSVDKKTGQAETSFSKDFLDNFRLKE